MASKKKTAPHDAQNPRPLKVGSRVRCTDDGVEGRIVWANAASVKIRWDDGEQVTWRRDSLADRPVEILDPPADEPTSPPDEPVPAPAPQPAPEETTTESPPAEVAEPPAIEPTPAPSPAPEPPAGAQSQAGRTPKSTKQRQRKEPKDKPGGKEKRLSALDAAAKVLAGASGPMSCQELIEAMAAKGYWSSPAGKTPAATLYSALLRETQTKGAAARFVKAERGKFALRDNGAQR